MKLEVGKTYIVEHSRKGVFLGEIVKDGEYWATVKVVKGHANFISHMNQARGAVGDVFEVRKSLCEFKEIDGGD